MELENSLDLLFATQPSILEPYFPRCSSSGTLGSQKCNERSEWNFCDLKRVPCDTRVREVERIARNSSVARMSTMRNLYRSRKEGLPVRSPIHPQAAGAYRSTTKRYVKKDRDKNYLCARTWSIWILSTTLPQPIDPHESLVG